MLDWSTLRATAPPPPRIPTGLRPLDAALGGGLVPGETVLLAGDPGAGKSTLLLQVAAHLGNAVYATAEERAFMVQGRAQRLGIENAEVRLAVGGDIARLLEDLAALKQPPAFLVIDSVQAFYDPACRSQPGTPNACRAVLARIIAYAARMNVPTVIVCQITKGNIAAGPKAMEHAVDASLHLSSFRALTDHRALRTDKNRYGPAGGTEVLQMTAAGLVTLR